MQAVTFGKLRRLRHAMVVLSKGLKMLEWCAEAILDLLVDGEVGACLELERCGHSCRANRIH